MPRLPRACPAGLPLHLVQRGHNKQVCFTATADYSVYVNYLHDAATRFPVDIHAWVFMTNHVHILATPKHEGFMSKVMQLLNRNYVRYFNDTYERTGTLREGRFKSCLVESTQYLLHCYRYIELNPVRAGLVDSPASYAWSSYRCNAWGVQSQLITPHPEYLLLGKDVPSRSDAYRELFKERLAGQLLQDIRNSTNQNMALGTNQFKSKMEAILSRRVRPASPGRPRKERCGEK